MSICDLAEKTNSNLDKDLDDMLNIALDIEKEYKVCLLQIH